MMKAIRYLRYSSDGQSAHSIERQDAVTASWLQHNGIELVDTFTDEGYSARTFDRPDIKSLFDFIRKNKHRIDYLVVAELTRFSRETGDAINMVKQIQTQYGIRIVSAGRSTIYDISDSNSFFMMGLEFLLGNSENIKRQNDINGGIYAAKAEKGRWIQGGPAPYGYRKEGTGEQRRLVPEESEAAIVRFIFRSWLQRVPVYVIKQQAKELGFRKTGSDAVGEILRNPLYMGFQQVKPWKNLPGGLFPLKNFEALVSQAEWQQAQELFRAQEKPRVQLSNEFPLRGVLRCECGRFVTGAPSKGRHGGWYNYYKCLQSRHLNLSTRTAHAALLEVWEHLSLPAHLIRAIEQRSEQLLTTRLQEEQKELLQQRTRLQQVQRQIESLEEKWISNQCTFETYNRWFATYNDERRRLQLRIEQLGKGAERARTLLKANLQKLGNLPQVWEAADVTAKQELVRRVFDNRLYWQDGMYRTPYLLPIFTHNKLILKQKQLLAFDGEEAGVRGGGAHQTPIEPLIDLLAFMDAFKVA